MNTASPINLLYNTRFNRYYNYITNAVFYAMSPRYLFQWYNNSLRECDYWLSGFVPGLHDTQQGVIPTQYAQCLCHKLADTIYGDGLSFKSTQEGDIDNSLAFLSNEIDDTIGLREVFKDGILKMVELGNCLLKINCGEDNKLWVDSIAGNRFFAALNSRGDVVGCKSFVNIFTSGNSRGEDKSFALMEERYWKTVDGERFPVVCYNIYNISIANTFTASNGVSLRYEDLPRGVQTAFREEYGDVYLGKEQRLPLPNLGVELLKYTKYISGMPNVKLGEPAIAKLLNDLSYYDLVASEFFNDVYISRAKVIIPQFMTKGGTNGGGYLKGLDDFLFTAVPNVSDREQTPTVFKPDMRIDSLTKAQQECVKTMAQKIGVSVSAIASDIADSHGTFTATQVTSQNSNTVLYATNKRALVTKQLNNIITTILHYYGKTDTVNISWAAAGGENKSVQIENLERLKRIGAVSNREIQEELHSDWTEDQIQAEVEASGVDSASGAERREISTGALS